MRGAGGPSADGLSSYVRAQAPTGRPARSGPPPRSRSSVRMNWRERKKFPVRAAPAEPFIRQDELARAQQMQRRHYNVRVCHLERSEGSLEWCRACWRVTRILHLRFRMTGYFASRLLPGAPQERRAVNQVKGGRRPVTTCPCKGVRLDARPGQGRPRGAAGRQPGWRERKKFPVRAALAEPPGDSPAGASAKNSRSGPPSRSRRATARLARAQKIPGQGRPRGAVHPSG